MLVANGFCGDGGPGRMKGVDHWAPAMEAINHLGGGDSFGEISRGGEKTKEEIVQCGKQNLQFINLSMGWPPQWKQLRSIDGGGFSWGSPSGGGHS